MKYNISRSMDNSFIFKALKGIWTYRIYILIFIGLGLGLFLLLKWKKKRALKNWTICNFMDLRKIRRLNGFDFEDYFFNQLRILGFNVSLTSKSGDFGIDLIMDSYGVQLKNYTSSVGVQAVQEVFTGAAYYNKIPVLLSTNYYTKPAIKLAKRLNIELIDLDDIKNWGNPYYKRKFLGKTGFYEEIRNCLMEDLKQARRCNYGG